MVGYSQSMNKLCSRKSPKDFSVCLDIYGSYHRYSGDQNC
jgi:hypothetical protein